MLEQQIMKVAVDEFGKAKTDLQSLAPQESLLSFYVRHDRRILEATTIAPVKPACRANCWYCCYYKVEAHAIEVFAIIDFAIRHYNEQTLKQVVDRAKKNVREAQGLSYEEHMTTNQQCPFLIDEKCSIYPVRPSKCRNFHASDLAGCQASYENPTDLTIPSSYISDIYVVSNGSSEGFDKAVQLSGFDHRMYDLNSAFIEALQNPKCLKRFKDKKKAFLTAKVVQVGEAISY